MVSIKWCLRKDKGLRITSPNKNMSNSYIDMARESLKVLSKLEESKIWVATTSYYVFYYSLYSLMLRIGMKCEIHSCSLEFMKKFLRDFYNNNDINMINKAFQARIDLQYYTKRSVDKKIVEQVKNYSKKFYINTKDILSKINEAQVEKIREEVRKLK